MTYEILVIEDEPSIRRVIKLVVSKLGHNVDTAENGEVGIKAYEEKHYDLVITDLIMPKVGGIDVIKNIRKISQSAKIIAISGGGRLDGSPYLKAAEENGANITLKKPFSISEIKAAIKSLLPSCAGTAM